MALGGLGFRVLEIYRFLLRLPLVSMTVIRYTTGILAVPHGSGFSESRALGFRSFRTCILGFQTQALGVLRRFFSEN